MFTETSELFFFRSVQHPSFIDWKIAGVEFLIRYTKLENAVKSGEENFALPWDDDVMSDFRISLHLILVPLILWALRDCNIKNGINWLDWWSQNLAWVNNQSWKVSLLSDEVSNGF